MKPMHSTMTKEVLGYVPKKAKKTRFNDECKIAQEEKDKARTKVLQNPSEENKRLLAQKQRDAKKKTIRRNKRLWEKERIHTIENNSSNNPKIFFEKANEIKHGYQIRPTVCELNKACTSSLDSTLDLSHTTDTLDSFNLSSQSIDLVKHDHLYCTQASSPKKRKIDVTMVNSVFQLIYQNIETVHLPSNWYCNGRIEYIEYVPVEFQSTIPEYVAICIEICDSNLQILNVSAKFPGSANDACVWNSSSDKPFVMNLHERGHSSYFLLGDSGYALRPWLMTPYLDPAPRSPEALYNDSFCSIRSITERCIGVLKMRFR
ncbi:hypothetical protein ACI65C_006643 [Semiaphis heraclei]